MKPFLFALLFVCHISIAYSSQSIIDSIEVLAENYKYSQALDAINKEIEAGRINKQIYLLKGKVLSQIYQFNASIESYQNAYLLDTTDVFTISSIASVYKSVQNYERSIYYCSKGLAYDSSNIFLALSRAHCLFLNEQYLQAKMSFLSIYKKDSVNFFVLTRLASCYSRLLIDDSALFYYEKARLVNPSDVNNLRNLCYLAIGLKKYKYGIARTEEFLAKDSLNMEVASLNAYIYLMDKQYNKSIKLYENCIRKGYTIFEVFKNIGIAYYRLNSFDTSKVYLEKAYKLDTTDVNNLEFLSNACLKSYYREQGIFYYEKYIELSCFNLEEYAQVYLKLYQACMSYSRCPLKKQMSVALKAYQLNPENKNYNMLYTIAYYYDVEEKNYQKAIKFYLDYLVELKKIKFAGTKNFNPVADIESRIDRLKELSKAQTN